MRQSLFTLQANRFSHRQYLEVVNDYHWVGKQSLGLPVRGRRT